MIRTIVDSNGHAELQFGSSGSNVKLYDYYECPTKQSLLGKDDSIRLAMGLSEDLKYVYVIKSKKRSRNDVMAKEFIVYQGSTRVILRLPVAGKLSATQTISRYLVIDTLEFGQVKIYISYKSEKSQISRYYGLISSTIALNSTLSMKKLGLGKDVFQVDGVIIDILDRGECLGVPFFVIMAGISHKVGPVIVGIYPTENADGTVDVEFYDMPDGYCSRLACTVKYGSVINAYNSLCFLLSTPLIRNKMPRLIG